MTERPIIFSGESVRAILEGCKSQTRRVIKPQPNRTIGEPALASCPYGQPGDSLWVRETWARESNFGIESSERYPPPHADGRPVVWHDDPDEGRWWEQAHYRATDPPRDLCCESLRCRDCERDGYGPHWRASIHMPRWASRLTLRVLDVRVERLQEISEEDAQAEGVEPASLPQMGSPPTHRTGFIGAWNRIYAVRSHGRGGDHSWETDPWVWKITFEVER